MKMKILHTNFTSLLQATEQDPTMVWLQQKGRAGVRIVTNKGTSLHWNQITSPTVAISKTSVSETWLSDWEHPPMKKVSPTWEKNPQTEIKKTVWSIKTKIKTEIVKAAGTNFSCSVERQCCKHTSLIHSRLTTNIKPRSMHTPIHMSTHLPYPPMYLYSSACSTHI